MLNVGIIGCGRISDLHAAAYRNNPDARIVAVCDTRSDIAAASAALWGVQESRIHSDYRAVLDDPDVDLVEILVPHFLHAQMATDALAAGKHVSLQKPIALGISEADDLISAASRARGTLKIFENFVFYPPVQKAKHLVDVGAIGTLLSIRLKSHGGHGRGAWTVPEAALAWRADAKQSGGGPQVFDDGHHKFAIAWHFMGLPSRVHSFFGDSVDGLHDGPSVITWTYSDGAVGSFEVVHSPGMEIETTTYAQDDRVELTGSDGVIWINGGHGRLYDEAPVRLFGRNGMQEFRVETDWRESFVRSGRDFVRAIIDGRPPLLTAPQAREVLSFALAAQRSAVEDIAVTVEDSTCDSAAGDMPVTSDGTV